MRPLAAARRDVARAGRNAASVLVEPHGTAHGQKAKLYGVGVSRGRVPVLVHHARALPDWEASGVRPQLDRHTAIIDGDFVLDFISVDSLLANCADLAAPLPCPRLR